MFSYKSMIPAMIVVLVGFVYFSAKNDPHLSESGSLGISEFRGNVLQLTDRVYLFESTVNIEREIMDFQTTCKEYKGTSKETIAGYSYRYCNTLLEMCRRREDLYRSYEKAMQRPPRKSIPSSFDKNERTEYKYSTGALDQWKTYVKNKQPILGKQLKQIIDSEEKYASSSKEAENLNR